MTPDPATKRGATDNAAGSIALRFKSATLEFLAAYVVVAMLAFGLYLLLAKMLDVPMSAPFDIRTDRAYSVAEQLYPILNLGVGTAFAWMYFRRHSPPSAKQALALGAFWLALALLLDLVYFVLIPNPLQVSAHAFYVEQSPWIYFTYLVVFIAPTAYRALSAHWEMNSRSIPSGRSVRLPRTRRSTASTLGDRIGRRRLLMGGAAALCVTSLLAAFSTSAERLIVSRALLGIAGDRETRSRGIGR